MRALSGLLLLMLAPVLAAQPVIELCSHECTTRENFVMEKTTWEQITALFAQPNMDAVKERRQLAEAMALLERDILRHRASRFSEDEFGDQLNEDFSNHDETRNTSRFIILLLDRGMIKHHVLRRSEKRHALFGPGQSTAVIQSRSDGQVYAVDSTSTGFGEQALVQPLAEWKNGTPMRKLGRSIGEIFSQQNDASREPAADE